MLDYETKKMLEEAWLCEMAMLRQHAEKRCIEMSYNLFMHIAKCFLFYNTQYYEHWLEESANFLIKCDDIRLKPKAKRPEKEFFLSTLLDEIETAADAKFYLEGAIDKCPEIERDDATNDEAFRFLDLWNELRIELADHLSDDDTFNRDEYMEIIDLAIKRNL